MHNNQMIITNLEKEGPFLKIWGLIERKASLEVEEALLRASKSFNEGKYTIQPECIDVGLMCCVKFVDEKYYRARISNVTSLSEGLVEINLLDFGTRDFVPITNLRSLECFNANFISLPPLAAPFILAEVVCMGGEWNDRIFEQIVKDIRYANVNYAIIGQATRYYFLKIFTDNLDLNLQLVRKKLMQSTSIQTQEAVLLAMIPRVQPQPTIPSQSLLQYKAFPIESNIPYEVYVSYISEGPSHFSVQLKKYEVALTQLMNEINSIPLKPLEDLPIPGTKCLAKCLEDNNICRAVVTSEVDSLYKLFYVDFGNTELVPPENLYQIAPKYVIPKIMAVRLSLNGIEKSSMTIEMQCAFKQFVDNRLLIMEVLPSTKKLALPKCSMWDPETNVNVLDVIHEAAIHTYPDPVALQRGFTQPIKVSYVSSCNRFCVQLKSKENDLDLLMEKLQNHCNSNNPIYLKQVNVGQPCCALFSFDQQWYRSIITEVHENTAKVKYIDYGNEEDVLIDSLKSIGGEFLTTLRPQAIECCLNGYQNMSEDQERDNKLEELILDQEYSMKVIDVIDNKILVDLMDSNNISISALLLESIMAQTKVQTTPVAEYKGNKFDQRDKRQSPIESINDNRNQKSYYQHDDRRPSRKRSDSNSNESTGSWRQDNRGFRNRNENDWNQRPDGDGFKKNREYKGSAPSGNNNERPFKSGNKNNDWGKKNDDRNTNDEWGSKNGSWNDNPKEPRKYEGRNNRENNRNNRDDGRYNRDEGSRQPRGASYAGAATSNTDSWNDNSGFKKKHDGGDSWGNTDNDYKQSRKPNNEWGDKSNKDDWGNKGDQGDAGDKGGWGGKKDFHDRKSNREWDSNKGSGFERKFGDRKENDRSNFKKKPFRKEGSEVSSSGSEKSFGKGFRTSSRNDNRAPRFEKKFQPKNNENSWNVSSVPSVIDSAPNDAVFSETDLNGKEERISISWFHNPCNFFVQLGESQESFKRLMEDIQNAYKDRPSSSCVQGAPAVGLFPEDNVLYRAKILEVIGSQYKIYYVDFGNVSIVDKVWPIEKKFMELPMQAIPCTLSNIEPVGDNWPNPDNFSNFFEKNNLTCKFLNKDSERYWVNLHTDDGDISEQIVGTGLAKFSELLNTDVDVSLLVGQQFRAIVKDINSLSDFSVLLQSGVSLICSLHNLSSATEINEDVLKQQLNQIVIVYADNMLEDRLEVTLYDSTGSKLNIIVPDEGAFETVDTLCPYLVIKSTITGFVCHINETSIVIQPDECSESIEYLLQQMYQYYENLAPDVTIIPEEEFVYATKSDDGNWYRGRVTAFDDEKATVVYIDYGNSEEVPFSKLRELIPEFIEWHGLAILVNVNVPATDFLEQDVTGTIYYGENGWEGEISLQENIHEAVVPAITQETVVEHPVEYTEDISEISTIQHEASSEIPICTEESSSGLCNEYSVGTFVILSHTDSPSDFYIQLADSQEALNELQFKLQEKIEEMAPLESVTIGGLCAAPYSVDQQWYRSQILDADDDITTVRFIDYGNTDVIDNKTTQIKTLPSELLSLEEYTRRCRLKIKPTEEEWSKASIDRFEELTSVDNLRVEFIDQDEKTNYVELFSDEVNVKDIMIQENLAVLDNVALEGKLTGYVSHINSPSEFWVQLESCCEELEWIAEQLSNAMSFPDLEDLTPGSLCAALYPDDEMWYRTRILSNTVAGIEVLFIDYGNSCITTNLKQLPEDLVMVPPLAQKCSLQKPEGLLSWSAEASQKFIELSASGQTIFTVKKLTICETSLIELLVDGEDVATKLLPTTDNGYVTDIESTESFTVSKDGVSGEKYSLEKIPGTDYNEECVEKFTEICDQGKTCFDVEYLPNNYVRLYLNGTDIRNELKNILSAKLQENQLTEKPLHETEVVEKHESIDTTCEPSTGCIDSESGEVSNNLQDDVNSSVPDINIDTHSITTSSSEKEVVTENETSKPNSPKSNKSECNISSETEPEDLNISSSNSDMDLIKTDEIVGELEKEILDSSKSEDIEEGIKNKSLSTIEENSSEEQIISKVPEDETETNVVEPEEHTETDVDESCKPNEKCSEEKIDSSKHETPIVEQESEEYIESNDKETSDLPTQCLEEGIDSQENETTIVEKHQSENEELIEECNLEHEEPVDSKDSSSNEIVGETSEPEIISSVDEISTSFPAPAVSENTEVTTKIDSHENETTSIVEKHQSENEELVEKHQSENEELVEKHQSENEELVEKHQSENEELIEKCSSEHEEPVDSKDSSPNKKVVETCESELNSSVNETSKVEFHDKILTSFPAPTVSENTEVTTKISPSKITTKLQEDSSPMKNDD